MKSEQTITVKGDRGFGTHEVTVLERRQIIEKEEFEKTGTSKVIWSAEMEDGKTVLITCNKFQKYFHIDPFLTEQYIN